MVNDKKAVLPHGELIALASNLWYIEGSIKMFLGELKRNMVVYRLSNGDLLLHSVVAMSEPGMKALEALGRPAYLVVPHGSHRRDATFYKERYPDIKVFAPAAARTKIEEIIRVDATEEEALPPLGIGLRRLEGMKPDKGENALVVDVEGGKALIMNDAISGGGGGFSGPTSNFMIRMFGPPEGAIGVARAVRWVGIADKAAVKESLRRLAEMPDLKILAFSHGTPVRHAVAENIRSAAAQLS
jgi:hypothetical protein